MAHGFKGGFIVSIEDGTRTITAMIMHTIWWSDLLLQLSHAAICQLKHTSQFMAEDIAWNREAGAGCKSRKSQSIISCRFLGWGFWEINLSWAEIWRACNVVSPGSNLVVNIRPTPRTFVKDVKRSNRGGWDGEDLEMERERCGSNDSVMDDDVKLLSCWLMSWWLTMSFCCRWCSPCGEHGPERQVMTPGNDATWRRHQKWTWWWITWRCRG